MSDLLPARRSPLAYDAKGEPITIASHWTGWLVKRQTGGRSSIVYDKTTGHEVVLPIDANMNDLRQAVQEEAGPVRLVPISANGKEHSPAAYAEVAPADGLENLWPPDFGASKERDQVFGIVERLLADREAREHTLMDGFKKLVEANAAIQQSVAGVLNAANVTIRIANGVEALERQPVQIDTTELAARLAEALVPDDEGKPATPWFAQLMQGPLGVAAMSFLSNFGNTLMAAQQAKAAPRIGQPTTAQRQPQPVAPASSPHPGASPAPATSPLPTDARAKPSQQSSTARESNETPAEPEAEPLDRNAGDASDGHVPGAPANPAAPNAHTSDSSGPHGHKPRSSTRRRRKRRGKKHGPGSRSAKP